MALFFGFLWFILLLKLFLAFFVIHVEGWQAFAIWNCLPLIVLGVMDLLIIWHMIEKTKKVSLILRAGFIGLELGTIPLILLGHVAWYFDLDSTATGSSTSGLIFIFIPIYAVIFGVITGFVCAGATAIVSLLYKAINE